MVFLMGSLPGSSLLHGNTSCQHHGDANKIQSADSTAMRIGSDTSKSTMRHL